MEQQHYGGECIYNLIPKIIPKTIKTKRYISKHNPELKPTGSTFGLQGKSNIEGSNLGEDRIKMDKKKNASSLGRILQKPNPKNYLKKGTGKEFTNKIIQTKPKPFEYSGSRKPSLIKKDDKPVMGLKSSKDFVTSNAVETILSVPGNRAKRQIELPNYTKKVDYGKVPTYLNDIKQEIKKENDIIDEFVRENQQLQQDENKQTEEMPNDERLELINQLKAKWDHVNKQYQKMVHNVIFDTQGKVRRKETLENQLTQIEKDIETLQRGKILITNSCN